MTNTARLRELWGIVRPQGGRFPVRPAHTPVQQTTFAHRYPNHFRWLGGQIASWPGDAPPRVVCIGGSIGVEGNSLARTFAGLGLFNKFPTMTIETIDIDPVATEIARTGAYPTDDTLTHFARVKDTLKKHIVVHDAGDHRGVPAGKIDVLLCNNVLGHLGREEGIALASWIHAQQPTYLMTGGRHAHGTNMHSRFNLQSSIDLNPTPHGEHADLFKITDWAAQPSFDGDAYRCIMR